MTTRFLLTRAEVAAQLGMTPATFGRRLATLRRAGFPAPVPHMGRRYDPRAIEAWLAAQRTPPGAPADDPTGAAPPAEDVAGWQAVLDRRAASIRH